MFYLLAHLGHQSRQILRQLDLDETCTQIAMIAESEICVLCQHSLDRSRVNIWANRSPIRQITTYIANSFNGTECFLRQALQLLDEFGRYNDLYALGGFYLVRSAIELCAWVSMSLLIVTKQLSLNSPCCSCPVQGSRRRTSISSCLPYSTVR
jgi:hypothetical protein